MRSSCPLDLGLPKISAAFSISGDGKGKKRQKKPTNQTEKEKEPNFGPAGCLDFDFAGSCGGWVLPFAVEVSIIPNYEGSGTFRRWLEKLFTPQIWTLWTISLEGALFSHNHEDVESYP